MSRSNEGEAFRKIMEQMNNQGSGDGTGFLGIPKEELEDFVARMIKEKLASQGLGDIETSAKIISMGSVDGNEFVAGVAKMDGIAAFAAALAAIAGKEQDVGGSSIKIGIREACDNPCNCPQSVFIEVENGPYVIRSAAELAQIIMHLNELGVELYSKK